MTVDEIIAGLEKAENSACRCLVRSDYMDFGFFAARWVLYTGLLPKEQKRRNPFNPLGRIAKTECDKARPTIPAAATLNIFDQEEGHADQGGV
jgi:hypothetical protein